VSSFPEEGSKMASEQAGLLGGVGAAPPANGSLAAVAALAVLVFAGVVTGVVFTVTEAVSNSSPSRNPSASPAIPIDPPLPSPSPKPTLSPSPKPTLSPSPKPAPASSVVMFTAGRQIGGGGPGPRPLADLQCLVAAPFDLSCSSYTAMLCYSGGDDLASHCGVTFPCDKPVEALDGTPVAGSLDDMLSGGGGDLLQSSLFDAGVIDEDRPPWSGCSRFGLTAVNGTEPNGFHNCNDWSSSSFLRSGRFGNQNVLTSDWLAEFSGGCANAHRHLVCICAP